MKKYFKIVIALLVFCIMSNTSYSQKSTLTIEKLYCYKIDNEFGEGYENRHPNNTPIKLSAGEHILDVFDAGKARSAYQITVTLEENKQYIIGSKKGEIIIECDKNKIDFDVKNITVSESRVEKNKMEDPSGKKQTFELTDLTDENSAKEPVRIYYYGGSNMSTKAVLRLFKVDDYWGFDGSFNHFNRGFIILLEPGYHKLEGITYAGNLGPSNSLEAVHSDFFEAGKEYVFKLTGEGRYTTSSIIEKE